MGETVFWRYFHKGRVIDPINYKGVCRTTPATPGLSLDLVDVWRLELTIASIRHLLCPKECCRESTGNVDKYNIQWWTQDFCPPPSSVLCYGPGTPPPTSWILKRGWLPSFLYKIQKIVWNLFWPFSSGPFGKKKGSTLEFFKFFSKRAT